MPVNETTGIRYDPDMTVRPCPICRKPVSWDASPWKPFCSERCKILDLGAWASGTYKIPDSLSDEEDRFSEGMDPPEERDS